MRGPQNHRTTPWLEWHRRERAAARDRTLARRALPFILAALLPFAVVPLPGPSWDPELLALGAAMTAAAMATCVLTPWWRLSDWWALVPALGYLGAVAVLREAGGGNLAGVGSMVLLPVIVLALYATRRVLVVTLVGVAITYWLPIVLDGDGDRYPPSGWRSGALFVALAAILAVMIQALVERIRRQAGLLDRLAHADEVTGLPNRRGWESALDAALAVARRRGEPLCVAHLDLDGFKVINDTHGHAAGDAQLARCARAWHEHVRGGDVLARVGGDEFALLLADCDVEEAVATVARLRAAAADAPFSAGVARWDGAEDASAVVRRADELLYEAKRRGRNRTSAQVPGPTGA